MSFKKVLPARAIHGNARVPGDKSIAHRLAIIGSISEGKTIIENFSPGADCGSTLDCLRRLGVGIERRGTRVEIAGRGLAGLDPPESELDAGNSGTTVRLLSGVLAAHPFETVIVGDQSLSRRPMERIVEPLRRFGAHVEAQDGRLPLRIRGGRLRAIEYRPPVSSAQVKSAVLLAAAHAEGTTSFEEPLATRNHTEIALKAAGARVRTSGTLVELDGGVPLRGRAWSIPGDVSSAAFLVAAALALPDSSLRLSEVGVNPTRSAYLSLLARAGGDLEQEGLREEGGEPVADLVVRSSKLSAIEVGPDEVPGLIDELPILAVLGACTGAGASIRGAGELRGKESDRISALVTNLTAIGFDVTEFSDGLEVAAGGCARGGNVRAFGDHRIAMAFAVAGLLSVSGVQIEDTDCAGISFPGFFDLLGGLIRT